MASSTPSLNKRPFKRPRCLPLPPTSSSTPPPHLPPLSLPPSPKPHASKNQSRGGARNRPESNRVQVSTPGTKSISSQQPPIPPGARPPAPPPPAAMIIKTLKARILRALKSSLPAEGADSPPTKPAGLSVHADSFSDDASFFDAREPETPTKGRHRPSSSPEPLDAWELVDQDGRAVPAPAAGDPAGPDPLLDFPARCPPGGERGVVLYTTTLRGVRRTFEDCNGVRALLENLAVAF
ncbi:hypothetical protein PVAP13_2NG044719 [Panicum virgatum]|uniref:Uncharacterized protein n=1 Tax=Panicum virgatum TaxID=38727 RepID=A0A8T0V4T6_PANVG|nr:hypothetical protein PVAP13_2NG044719 [Panicum virgatum]